jgi:hypothetical protein
VPFGRQEVAREVAGIVLRADAELVKSGLGVDQEVVRTGLVAPLKLEVHFRSMGKGLKAQLRLAEHSWTLSRIRHPKRC